jgi:hypothetical protein
MGHPLDPAPVDRCVEVGIEDASAAAILQLEPWPLADLQAGASEQLAEFGHREAREMTMLVDARAKRRGAGLRLDHRRARVTGAGGEEQGEGGGKTAEHRADPSR